VDQGHVALVVLGTEKRKGSPLTDRQPRLGVAARRHRRTCQFSAQVSLRVKANQHRLLFRRALDLGTRTCGEAMPLADCNAVIATVCCGTASIQLPDDIRDYLSRSAGLIQQITHQRPSIIFTKAQTASGRRSQRRQIDGGP
jgi:hypothetical protein